MKQTIAILLVSVMLLGIAPFASAAAGMDNFQKTQTYNAGQFADVKSADWFAPGVQSAFELGLMKGSSDTAFKPTGNLTVAEALTIACRLHSIYAANGETFVQGNPWYQVYVDYAVANKIMTAGQLTPTAQITREQFAYLMCGAIPESDLNAINTITEIPDEKAASTYGGFVYRLYNAGVLTGSDKYGTFKPTTAIQRGEVATIVTRMADKSQRIKFTPEKAVTDIQLSGKTTIMVGENTIWVTSPLPEDAKAQFTWTSSNTDVATVDQEGVITAKSAGESDITVTAENGVKKTVKVTVNRGGTLQMPYDADGSMLIPFQNYYSQYYKNIKITCNKIITGAEANKHVGSYAAKKATDGLNWRIYEFFIEYISNSDDRSDTELGGLDLFWGNAFFTTGGASAPIQQDAFMFEGEYAAYGTAEVKLYPGASSKIAVGLLLPNDTGDLLLKLPNEGSKPKTTTWVKCVPVANSSVSKQSATKIGASKQDGGQTAAFTYAAQRIIDKATKTDANRFTIEGNHPYTNGALYRLTYDKAQEKIYVDSYCKLDSGTVFEDVSLALTASGQKYDFTAAKDATLYIVNAKAVVDAPSFDGKALNWQYSYSNSSHPYTKQDKYQLVNNALAKMAAEECCNVAVNDTNYVLKLFERDYLTPGGFSLRDFGFTCY